METYKFTLIIEGADILTEERVDALYEAGCHDTLIGQTNEVQYIYFHRDAGSLDEAVRSATADVEGTVRGAKIVRCFTDEQEDEHEAYLLAVSA